MSRLFISNAFGTDASPFAVTGFMGVASGRLNGGFTSASDGQAQYTIPQADRPNTGSRKGLRLHALFDFQRDSGPTGGLEIVLRFTGTNDLRLKIADGATVLSYDCGGASANGATALGTGSHTIEIDYREEGTTHWMRVYLDGASEINNRDNSGNYAVQTCTEIFLGVAASAKCTWASHWDNMKIWFESDPQ